MKQMATRKGWHDNHSIPPLLAQAAVTSLSQASRGPEWRGLLTETRAIRRRKTQSHFHRCLPCCYWWCFLPLFRSFLEDEQLGGTGRISLLRSKGNNLIQTPTLFPVPLDQGRSLYQGRPWEGPGPGKVPNQRKPWTREASEGVRAPNQRTLPGAFQRSRRSSFTLWKQWFSASFWSFLLFHA